MDEILEQFRHSFRIEELRIFQNVHWTVSIRPEQITLGSLVVSSRDGARHFSEIGPAQGASLAAAFAYSEKLVKDVFGAVRINVICLMMKDPIVHFHVLPRYDSERTACGQTWRDLDWPGPPSIIPSPTDNSCLQKVLQELRD